MHACLYNALHSQAQLKSEAPTVGGGGHAAAA